MRAFVSYPLPERGFKQQLLNWSKQFSRTCILDGSNHPAPRSNQPLIYVAVEAIDEIEVKEKNAFDGLHQFYESKKDWLFGFLSYDLKNELESLESDNHDGVGMPQMHFFQPRYLFLLHNNELRIGFLPTHDSEEKIEQLLEQIKVHPKEVIGSSPDLFVQARISKQEYLAAVSKLKKHIRLGDIYEINFCQEFYAEKADINPFATYDKLYQVSPTPFSCFYQLGDKFLMCGSPERFLRRKGDKLISQPIKGTAPRGKTKKEDEAQKTALYESPKERSENVMIVDLVRNDLSRSAKKGSVKVDELFGIYSFPKVHQMISTISSELRENVHFIDAIRYAFPMGSMTGAPKIRAMELIEQYEATKRGLYSGSVGYINANGDFDFNVVIRSILYNASTEYLSFMVGGAIIDAADPEKEYEECLLKARAIIETLDIQMPA